MIESEYLTNIINLLVDSNDVNPNIRSQVELLTVTEYTYTSSGLFVSFSSSEEIIQYKIDIEDLVLGGVRITSSEPEVEADATLFFKNGIINYLEIWCYHDGYPEYDLSKYTLTQFWNGSSGKQWSNE